MSHDRFLTRHNVWQLFHTRAYLILSIVLLVLAPASATLRAADHHVTRPPMPAGSNSKIFLPMVNSVPPPFVALSSIGGPVGTVAVSGTLAYIGEGGSLTILDVSNPAAPLRRGSLPLLGLPAAIQVIGSTVYVAAGRGGLEIIDASDPTRPVLRGATTPASGSQTEFFTSVQIVGHLAYISEHTAGGHDVPPAYGFAIFDISNPTRPVQVGLYGGVSFEPSTRAQVVGNLAYLIGLPGLTILDVSNPISPTLISNTMLTANDLQVVSTKVYLATSQGLQVVDVSNPVAPVLRGSVAISGGASNLQVTTEADGVTPALAYLATNQGLQVADVSDPDSPTLRGSATTTAPALYVRVAGTLAYLAVGQAGLTIIDVSSPSAPVARGSYTTINSVWSVQTGLSSDHTTALAYITTAHGLTILDVHNPSIPIVLGSYAVAGGVASLDVAVEVAQPTSVLAYLVTNQGLTILDVSDPHTPVLRGNYIVQRVRSVQVVGMLAYLVIDSTPASSMQIVNVSDPTHPTLRGTYAPDSGVNAAQVAEPLAYVATGPGTIFVPSPPRGNDILQMLNVSNPASPVIRGSAAVHAGITDIQIAAGSTSSGSSTMAYMSYIDSGVYTGLQIVDVSNPEAPAVRGSLTEELPYLNEPSYADAVQVAGSTAYLALTTGVVQTVNVSNPLQPQIQFNIPVADSAVGIAVAGAILYVADNDGGLRIVQITSPG